MMNDLSGQYAETCRLDYVKFSFVDGGPVQTNAVRDEVNYFYEELKSNARFAGAIPPKYTFLRPAASRPLGRFIVELFGVAAIIAEKLPVSWLMNLTYAHVKAYGSFGSVADLKLLQWELLGSEGPRNISLNKSGKRSRTSKGMQMPSIRLGSRKSDWHGVTYCRVGENLGFEGRFTDETLAQNTLAALDMREATSTTDAGTWRYLIRRLGRDSAVYWAGEFAARGINLSAYIGGFDGFDRYRDAPEGEDLGGADLPPELPSPADGAHP